MTVSRDDSHLVCHFYDSSLYNRYLHVLENVELNVQRPLRATMKPMNKPVIPSSWLRGLLAGLIICCGANGNAATDASTRMAQSGMPGAFDCIGNSCPLLEIAGDWESTLPNGQPSPFRGFADPSMRRDPDSGRLWLAYSWPSLQVKRSSAAGWSSQAAQVTPRVDIHLAFSDDHGASWRYLQTLLPAAAARSPSGEPGQVVPEVVNLLPVQTESGTQWYGAWLEYFLPENGGYRNRPSQSFRIVMSRSPGIPGLADAPKARLGAMHTDPAWGMDLNLAALSPETSRCMLWNEPALYHDGKELFLALSCMAFRGTAPDLPSSDLVVFATTAQGEPALWRWRYAGKLSGVSEARELGGERLTQIDLVPGRDGQLLAVVTPDTWDATAHDFVHHGCRVLEVTEQDGRLTLARSPNGALKLRTSVMASDAGAAGTAACTYEPSSATGMVFGKRDKAGGLSGRNRNSNAHLSTSLHITGLRP